MSALTRWQNIPRIATGTDTEMSVLVGERVVPLHIHQFPSADDNSLLSDFHSRSQSG